MQNNTPERQLAAAVLLEAFDNLSSPERTASVYAAFFYTDYCKGLFDLAGVVYDPQKIGRLIANRPKRKNTETCEHIYGRFTLQIRDGYITAITDRQGNLYHLESVSDRMSDTSYYYDTVRSSLSRGRLVFVGGV